MERPTPSMDEVARGGAPLAPTPRPLSTFEDDMRVLITGGAGFLGSHLCERFIADGHEVLAVDNFVTGSAANIEHLLANPRFGLRRQDVSAGLDADGALDGVLHLASPASPIDYLELPVETLLVGSAGTHNALELARSHGARFLMASTS